VPLIESSRFNAEQQPDGQSSLMRSPSFPGKHTYRFIVDGNWCDDPECSLRVANPFGGEDMVREAA